MTKKITIHWGSDKEPQNKETYTFENDEQLKYFMMGVDEADGWLEYEVLDDQKTRLGEYPSPAQPLALARGSGAKLQAAGGKLQAPSSKLDKTEL